MRMEYSMIDHVYASAYIYSASERLASAPRASGRSLDMYVTFYACAIYLRFIA